MEIFPGGGATYLLTYILQVGVAGGLSSGIFSVQIYNNFKLCRKCGASLNFFLLKWIRFDKICLKKCLPAFALPQAPKSSNLLGGTSPSGEGGRFYIGGGP